MSDDALFIVRNRKDWSQHVGSLPWVVDGLLEWGVPAGMVGSVVIAVIEGRLDDAVEYLGSVGVDFVVFDWLREVK